jgi:hypothetical protein
VDATRTSSMSLCSSVVRERFCGDGNQTKCETNGFLRDETKMERRKSGELAPESSQPPRNSAHPATMSSMNLDASLDDMIKAAPRKGGAGGRGGKGGDRKPKGGGKEGGGGKSIPKPRNGGGGGGRGAGGVRAKVIAKPRRGPTGGRSVANANWDHDMYQGGNGGNGGGRSVSARIGGGAGGGGGGSAKLLIGNLHFNVSNQDVKASHSPICGGPS